MSSELHTQENDTTVQRVAVLIVDDEVLFGKAVRRRLLRSGYDCTHVDTLAAARAALQCSSYDLLLLDMRLPDGSGTDFLQALRTSSDVPVIAMTAYGDVEDAVVAMKYGASDYLKKPLDLDELVLNMEKVIAMSAVQLRLDYSRVRERNVPETPGLLGASPAIVHVREQLIRIAPLAGDKDTPPTVLISGETGTGKDVAARLLHSLSARASRPFVHIDCAALPNDLIESELFGHVKGAFTNAVAERTGLIEAAEDGVVFLDEIAELSLELQAKLLAVLERRVLRRIGSSRERPVRAWFIAATNRALDKMIKEGRFRADLFFRLHVLSVSLPPLRERGADIGILAQHFAHEVAQRYGRAPAAVDGVTLNCLMSYAWPGNVRELSHVIERAMLLAADGMIDPAGLSLPASEPSASMALNPTIVDAMTLAEVEKLMIVRALTGADGNVSEAARQLGITRMAMRYRLKKYQLRHDNDPD